MRRNDRATLPDDRLHDVIFRLSQRRRDGDQSCDEILGRLLDEADRRSNEDVESRQTQKP
jgi:hypothetical protein